MSQVNPYASPMSEDAPARSAAGDTMLASRLSRLGAAILDSLLMLVISLPINLFVFTDLYAAAFDFDADPVAYQRAVEAATPGIAVSLASTVLGLGLFLAVNGYWLATNGQSAGKRLLGIKIVRKDGNQATLGRIVSLRYGPVWAVSMIPVPFVNLIVLANALLIFRSSRYCLHDDIADRVVIQA